MKKRILSLICVLALCLGLLPVTALAADAPNTLWVGQTQITESGCYENKNGTWTRVDGAEPASGQFYYDGNGTLTLNNATIQGRGNSSKAEPQDYGIYAATTSDQSVSLTIKLIGSNTVSGYSGICVDASNGNGNSTLVIQSVGNDPKDSLEAIGSGWNGITISSQSGNASLTINNASVVANIEGQSYHGVSIKSNSQGSPALSLSVDGGSLTAQSTNGYGIVFSVSYGTTDPSTSMTVQNNALVKATSINASQVSEPTPQGTGIVFNGNTGTVYGDVSLDKSLTIGEGETLTIPDDSSLNSNGKLTNNGKIIVDNGGKLEGTINGNQPPKITTTSLSEGTVNAAYSQTLAATGESITWSVASGSTLPGGLNLEKDTITGTPTTAGDSTFIVTATNTNGSDSKEYTLTINPAPVLVTGISLNNSNLSLYTGKTATLTATVTPENATNKAVTWKSSDDTIATVDNNGKVTAVKEGTATITATATDGSGVYATCTVTVNQSTYSISADTTAIDFGSAYTSYTQPAAKTVTITNTGNQTLTLNQPAPTVSFEVGWNRFENDLAGMPAAAGRGFMDHQNQFYAEAGITFRLGRKTWKAAADVSALNEMTQTELDALNAMLADERADNERLRSLHADAGGDVRPTDSQAAAGIPAPAAVFFNIGEAEPADRRGLVNVEPVARYAAARNATVLVAGYADSATGSPERNRELSRQRAEKVAAVLADMGVKPENIRVEARGGVDTYAEASFNRRVIVEIVSSEPQR